MSWVTQVWSVAAGVCFALAGLHIVVWLRSRESAASLLFSFAAIAAGSTALHEIVLMRAATAAEYGEALRWMHFLAAVLVISMVWFIRLHLHAGRLWLAWTITGLRAGVLLANFLTSSSATFSTITGLRAVPWMGEVFSIPIGEPNPWRVLIHASTALLFVYVLDAGITAWRGAGGRRAVIFCGAILSAIVLTAIVAQLMIRQAMPGPFIGLIFLLVILAMAVELSIDLVRAKQTAADLRRSEARMSLAAAAANLGLWEWDIERDRIWGTGTGLAVQAGLKDSDGLTFERFLNAVHADDRGIVRQAMRRVVEEGESINIEYRTVDSLGSVRWITARGEADRDPGVRPRHVRGVTMDVTNQKLTDAKLQAQRDQLAHIQRVSALGQLSSALAHEISQPLGAILRNAEAGELFLRNAPLDIDELSAILRDIQRDDQRAAAIIDRMRAFLRTRALVRETVNVRELLQQVATFLEAESRAHDTRLVLDLPDALPAVRGDRIQLQQVVLNLVLNSLEALNEFPPERREVVIRASSTADLVEVAVMDKGPGFADGQMDGIFEPFMSTKKTGTGIGLSICKTIVESHGGCIWADLNPGGGAIVRFTLRGVQSEDKT